MGAMAESASPAPARNLPIPVASAPWKVLLSENIQQTSRDNPAQLAEFHLATITPSGQPRVRTVYHRSFWGEHIGPSSTSNPPLYESDCPTFITGARSNKGRDIYAAGLDQCRSQMGSGGGAQVEILYWFRDLGVQWRIRGRCWLMSSEDPRHEQGLSHLNQGIELARQAVYAYMRTTRIGVGAPMEKEKGEGFETHITESEEEARWFWNEEIESYAATLDAKQRNGFEQSGFRVGIILPEAVERRDEMKNCKNLWSLLDVEIDTAVNRREWVAVEAWP